MSTMNDIEKLAHAYADSYALLNESVQQLEDEMRALKRKYLPAIKRRAALAAERKGEALAAVKGAKALFQKPKTRVFAGVKVGFRKKVGEVVIEDEEATIKRIHKLLPEDQVELLIRTLESVHKPAVKDLTVGDLERLGIEIEDDTDVALVQMLGQDIEKLVDALLKGDEQREENAAA